MVSYVTLKNESKQVGGITKQRILLKQSNNTPLDIEKIKTLTGLISDKYEKEKKKEPKILVRGLGIQGVRTIKGYSESIEDMFDDIDDYLGGRVKEKTKFMEFTEIEITLYS
jgi:hypothetical protein